MDFFQQLNPNIVLILNIFRIIGAVLIVIGLYFVLWGKSAEEKKRSNIRADEPDLSRNLLGNDSSQEIKSVTVDVP
jgi:hypothetical protein